MSPTQEEKNKLISFYVLLAITSGLLLMVWLPFLQLLALGAVLAVLFMPLRDLIRRKIKSPAWSALLTLLIMIAVVLTPMYFIGRILVSEIGGLYAGITSGHFTFSQDRFISYLPPQFRGYVAGFSGDISAQVSSIASGALRGISSIISHVATFLFGLVIICFTAYYLMKDGDKFKGFLNDTFPMPAGYESAIMNRLGSSVNGIINGQFIIALIQGALATIGFLAFGIPNPIVWGMLTVFAALVPNIGAPLSVISATLFLLLSGHVAAAIGMAIWGTVTVWATDTFLGPKIVGSRLKLHPFLALISIFGGLKFFGIFGFLFGPILMAIFMTLLDIYRTNIPKTK